MVTYLLLVFILFDLIYEYAKCEVLLTVDKVQQSSLSLLLLHKISRRNGFGAIFWIENNSFERKQKKTTQEEISLSEMILWEKILIYDEA